MIWPAPTFDEECPRPRNLMHLTALPFRSTVWPERCDHGVRRVLNELDLHRAGAVGVNCEWRATRIDHDHDLGPLALLGGQGV